MKNKTARVLLCCLCLAFTVLLGRFVFGKRENAPSPSASFPLVRIWIGEKDAAAAAWLRKRAAAYEKETGTRVYLRSASEEEARGAMGGDNGLYQPDLLVISGGKTPVALRGYVLIARDDTAPARTPAPSFALFIRPTSAPDAPSAPSPSPKPFQPRSVLAPEEMLSALSGTVFSADPAAGLAKGTAEAAILTAPQAEALTFGYQAYPLPGGKGLVPIGATDFSEAGQAFLCFLLSPASQRALAQHSLYSPCLALYQGQDPLRALIENGKSDFFMK